MRIAVVSPFVDRRHGAERALAELLEHLARMRHCEIHLYAQRVEDLVTQSSAAPRRVEGGAILWHKVPSVPGPHLFQFLSWFFLNGLCRWRDRCFHGLHFDALFSPGINCYGANVILVHAVFHRLAELQEQSTPSGLRSVHQRLYYRVLRSLERRIYSNRRVLLAAVSQRTAKQIGHYFGREDVMVIPNGVDTSIFHPQACRDRRADARVRWNFAPREKVLLLIGNDWRNKGLTVLLRAAALCRDLPLRLLVVGRESASSWVKTIAELQLADRVSFSLPSANVLDFLAAADVYAAPSLEDSFNLPALEAMACGLPVIVSTRAGISEWIHNGSDGMLLQDPQDPAELAAALQKLIRDPESMRCLGENAARTATTLSWDSHADAIYNLLRGTLVRPVNSAI